jgi:protein-tyrosine phosphatase
MRVLCVCLGNICRSPTAEGVLREIARREAPQLITAVDSAGTAGYHVGDPPDPRTVAAARSRGYDLSELRARQVHERDFSGFDLILAMDRSNLATLRRVAPTTAHDRLGLFLQYSHGGAHAEVPDPYYGGRDDFELVLDLVEQGARALLAHLREQQARR